MKKYLWMSPAAVVIGALRVKYANPFSETFDSYFNNWQSDCLWDYTTETN